MVVKLSTTVKVAALYRMSDDSQDTSIPDQEQAVRAYCKSKGYELVREYYDHGISGSKLSDVSKRVGFQEMLIDAAKDMWQGLIVWNTSRFGRLDTFSCGFAVDVFRQNRKWLETCHEGRIDWNTFAGRVQFAVLAELNHEKAVELGRDTIRGRIGLVNEGYWAVGLIPYGFDRLYVKKDGSTVRMARKDRAEKAQDWRLSLIPNEDEAKIVRYIFETYANSDLSPYQLAVHLNEKGIPAPRAGAWSDKTVRRLLTHPAYIGQTAIGRIKSNAERFNPAPLTQAPAKWAGIIPPELFDIVQTKLARNTKEKFKPQHRSSALSGIILCAQCRKRMHKRPPTRSGGRITFTCYEGSAKRSKCHQWTAHEDVLLPLVCRKVVKEVDRVLLDRANFRPGEEISNLDVMKAHEKELAAQVDRAAERFLKSPKLASVLEKKLEQMQEQLDEVRNKIQVLEVTEATQGINGLRRLWEATRTTLITVAQAEWSAPRAVTIHDPAKDYKAIAEANGAVTVFDEETSTETHVSRPGVHCTPEDLRELLKRLGVQVYCFFKPRPCKGKKYQRWEMDRTRLKIRIRWKHDNGRDTSCKRGACR